MRRLAVFPLFVNRFRRSLLLYNLELDKEAISEAFMAHFCVFRGKGDEF